MSLGWAVLGTGAHVTKCCPRWGGHRTPGSAVCSRDLGRAQALAGQFGAASLMQYEALLRDGTVDVVYICTPNSLHAEQAIKRLGRASTSWWKPMARVADAEAMVRPMKRKAGVHLGVGFHLRHHPAQRDARELIQGGRLGGSSVRCPLGCREFRRTGWWEDAAMVGACPHGPRGSPNGLSLLPLRLRAGFGEHGE
ncbi:MAG: Gfo/Idh/MocA family oxidoreductase [Desulfobacterales bacterium]|nr:Gfo/Idh/MocA family oxidoreductase [Desulfobacterales bacterium]